MKILMVDKTSEEESFYLNGYEFECDKCVPSICDTLNKINDETNWPRFGFSYFVVSNDYNLLNKKSDLIPWS